MKEIPNQDNWGILGHEKIVQFLRISLKSSKMAHAYLFCGQKGLGKNTVAEKFAQSLACESQTKPCGECYSCRQYLKNSHPDIFRIVKAEDKKNISVEDVRDIQKLLSQKSFLNSYKVLIIDGAEDLSESASNSLLKTLEEPSSKTVIILVASQKDALLKTITSRCQVINFLPVAKKEIFKHLEKAGISRQQSQIMVNLANGIPAVIYNYLNNSSGLTDYQKQIEFLIALSSQDVYKKFEFSAKALDKDSSFSRRSSDLEKIIDRYYAIVRDLVLIKSNQSNLIANLFAQEKLEKLSVRYSIFNLIQICRSLKKAKELINANVSPSLNLENILLNF